MKISIAVTLALAGTGLAVPTLSARQFFSTDGRPTYASDIFDTAACIVSSFIGGGNPLCHGRGDGKGKGGDGKDKNGGSGATVPDKDKASGSGGSKDTGYTYDFVNHADGSATYTVKPNRNGKSCKVTLKKEERDDLNAVLGKLAKECS
ncbi:hypothetical protein NLU13_3265 [Sarocladium strictum]|uniref:Uncharacterized protein n=1 Tax=Sarocladium strictum TaxID=5046 RepID=A0AA39GLR0_SARSR|nr:hypothetical protein NLU13_3265 [Sarocladium strictum]